MRLCAINQHLTDRLPPRKPSYCAVSQHSDTDTEVSMNKHYWTDGLVFPMHRGPFQNNGAAPWYSTLSLGTPGQPLKLTIDTGTNITWITSTLCPTDQCKHFAGRRFDYKASTTFSFVDCLQRPYSFGPWGTMQVEAGTDVLSMPNGASLPTNLFLAAYYSGDQFRQLDWDGGIGLPASSVYVEGRSSFLLQELLHSDQINPEQPYVCFDWDAKTHSGTCTMGAIDKAKTQGAHVFLPWSAYQKTPGLEYLWATDLSAYSVGGKTLATHLKFALDSGSSQFKGDDTLMKQTLQQIACGEHPDIVLDFADGQVTLGANLYNVLIEQGPQKGQTVPQFFPLGLADLVLVGSLLMEHCYTVYEYQVIQCGPTAYSLAPVGIWLFNRPDGPQLITRPSAHAFKSGPRRITCESLVRPPTPATVRPPPWGSVEGTWTNDYGSVMNLRVSGNQVSGEYSSSTGSTGHYEVTGYQMDAAATQQLGQPVALAIEWRSISEGSVDPSWNWSSGLCGQISLVGAEEVLTLNHLLVASRDFAAVASQGTYIDKLLYRRSGPTQDKKLHTAPSLEQTLKNALTGTWQASDGTRLTLAVKVARQGRLGRVHGHLSTPSGLSEVSGFTDINATASELPLQSMAITAAQKSCVVSLSGALDIKRDVLSLQVLTSAPTAPDHAYVQTQLSSLTFERITP